MRPRLRQRRGAIPGVACIGLCNTRTFFALVGGVHRRCPAPMSMRGFRRSSSNWVLTRMRLKVTKEGLSCTWGLCNRDRPARDGLVIPRMAESG
jgi:hypothetical protein